MPEAPRLHEQNRSFTWRSPEPPFRMHETRAEDLLRSAAGGRRFIARAGEITFTTHLVRFAPSCAAVVSVDAHGRELRTPAEDPERQFEVLAGGATTADRPSSDVTRVSQ